MTKTKLFCTAGLFLWYMNQSPQLQAQRLPLEEFPALRNRAMVFQISAKIEENNRIIWNAMESRTTISGRPVQIRLVGENLIVSIQFTPYLHEANIVLVAQSQIWINIPEKGMIHRTSSHSIPISMDEPILYFPLGSDRSPDTPQIELQLTMHRFGEEPPADNVSSPENRARAGENRQNRQSRPSGSTTEQPGNPPNRTSRRPAN